MTPPNPPLKAGPELDGQIADACGLERIIYNDAVCHVRIGPNQWNTFHPSTNLGTARAAAAKIGLAGVSETATALEICEAILDAARQRIIAADGHADKRPTSEYNQLPADTWGKHPGMPTRKPEESVKFINADNVGKRKPQRRR